MPPRSPAGTPVGSMSGYEGSEKSVLVEALSQLGAYAASNGTEGNNTNSTGGPKSLGKDDFLKLLLMELRYQDPLKPFEDREFIAQLAQFSALEQSQNMNQNLQKLLGMQTFATEMTQATALIGKNVTVLDAATGGTLTGKVDSVRLNQGIVQLVIGGKAYDLGSLVEVGAA